VCENIPSGAAFRQTLASARLGIQEGLRLADALQPLYASAPQMIDMIRTGEEVNRLDDMLLRTADLAEAGVKTRIDRLFTLLTPVITSVMGLLIGGLIVSIMSAILSVNDLTAAP
jgi:general secretion pathway protein F